MQKELKNSMAQCSVTLSHDEVAKGQWQGRTCSRSKAPVQWNAGPRRASSRLPVFPSCRPPNFVDGAGLAYPPKTSPSHRRRARFTCTPHARQLSPYRPSSPRLKRDTDAPKIRLARSQSAPRLGGSPPEDPRNPPPTAISISDRPRVDLGWTGSPPRATTTLNHTPCFRLATIARRRSSSSLPRRE